MDFYVFVCVVEYMFDMPVLGWDPGGQTRLGPAVKINGSRKKKRKKKSQNDYISQKKKKKKKKRAVHPPHPSIG
jgi:hypothetical protein